MGRLAWKTLQSAGHDKKKIANEDVRLRGVNSGWLICPLRPPLDENAIRTQALPDRHTAETCNWPDLILLPLQRLVRQENWLAWRGPSAHRCCLGGFGQRHARDAGAPIRTTASMRAYRIAPPIRKVK